MVKAILIAEDEEGVDTRFEKLRQNLASHGIKYGEIISISVPKYSLLVGGLYKKALQFVDTLAKMQLAPITIYIVVTNDTNVQFCAILASWFEQETHRISIELGNPTHKQQKLFDAKKAECDEIARGKSRLVH